jgi:hypothetical protein
MNSERIIWMAPVVAGAMLLGGNAFGRDAPVDTLVIIEHSSTSLTATFNGTDIPAADIANTSSDHWSITLPGITENVIGGSTWLEGFGQFSEPIDNNVFGGGGANPSTVTVISDPLGAPFNHQNGETDTTSFTIGTATSSTPLIVTFTDNGDSVPDAATTWSLLTLSLAGLGIFRKTFSIF